MKIFNKKYIITAIVLAIVLAIGCYDNKSTGTINFGKSIEKFSKLDTSSMKNNILNKIWYNEDYNFCYILTKNSIISFEYDDYYDEYMYSEYIYPECNISNNVVSYKFDNIEESGQTTFTLIDTYELSSNTQGISKYNNENYEINAKFKGYDMQNAYTKIKSDMYNISNLRLVSLENKNNFVEINKDKIVINYNNLKRNVDIEQFEKENCGEIYYKIGNEKEYIQIMYDEDYGWGLELIEIIKNKDSYEEKSVVGFEAEALGK